MTLNPTTEAEVAQIVADQDTPLAIHGGATRAPLGNGAPMSLSGLAGITLYDPGALTLVARAGTPIAEVEAALQAERQMLPFEPMDHRALMGTEGTPTVGGMVGLNASGPRRLSVGACRDSLIGVRYVDGRGDIIKNGGRVMKNVTGYDLVKLMAGSRGTLGVMTELSFKLLPRPEAMATLRLSGQTISDAVTTMSAALGSPFQVTGAAHHPGGETLIRLEGFAASVTERAGKLQEVLSRFGAVSVTDGGQDDWTAVRDVSGFAGSGEDIWRLSVRPSDAPGVTGALGDARMLIDHGGGLIWAAVAPGTDVRAALGQTPGHATLVRAGAETHRTLGTLHPEPAPLAALAKGLREKFDPKGILNPGAMG